jgi:hypothetical protein
MADTAVAITAGAGTNIDTRTEATNGNHRQVVVIGDPSTNAGVAAVDATTGLAVNVTNATLTIGGSLPAGTAAIGKLAANSGVDIGDVDVTSFPRASTATLANVSGSASSVTLQASNAARMGLHIFNDSTARLYVKYGSSASTTSFVFYLEEAEGRYLNDGYTGIVTGIWASATGDARMTELTA